MIATKCYRLKYYNVHGRYVYEEKIRSVESLKHTYIILIHTFMDIVVLLLLFFVRQKRLCINYKLSAVLPPSCPLNLAIVAAAATAASTVFMFSYHLTWRDNIIPTNSTFSFWLNHIPLYSILHKRAHFAGRVRRDAHAYISGATYVEIRQKVDGRRIHKEKKSFPFCRIL